MSNSNVPHKHSEFGIASCIIGGAMLVVQFALMLAALLGVKGNQGATYAFFFPCFMYLIGVPLGLVAATIGKRQANRDHWFAWVGYNLTLAGPLAFILVCVVLSVFHLR